MAEPPLDQPHARSPLGLYPIHPPDPRDFPQPHGADDAGRHRSRNQGDALMLTLWRQRPYLVSAFLLACAVTLFFGARFVTKAVYWADPAHHNQAVQGWMTVGYIGKSWNIDPRRLDELAKLPLVEIARDRGVSVETVIAEVEAALAILQSEKPQE